MLLEDMTHVSCPSSVCRFSVLCTYEVPCRGTHDGFSARLNTSSPVSHCWVLCECSCALLGPASAQDLSRYSHAMLCLNVGNTMKGHPSGSMQNLIKVCVW